MKRFETSDKLASFFGIITSTRDSFTTPNWTLNSMCPDQHPDAEEWFFRPNRNSDKDDKWCRAAIWGVYKVGLMPTKVRCRPCPYGLPFPTQSPAPSFS